VSWQYYLMSRCILIFIYDVLISLRIVCKTEAMSTSTEGTVIVTIGEAVILWDKPFKYQVPFHCFIGVAH